MEKMEKMKKTDELRDALLADEIDNIMRNAVKEIFERTKGNKSARELLIVSLFHKCIMILTNSKYSSDQKIASFKEGVEYYVSILDRVH